ncbi:MAG TPA: efflux RND transporter permease subunit [Candidatus Acidoferrales bacterium]|jgi:HAE1 family hydrophobic/amphiphilic exporter-1|nr:efflux RND transporter permease subunit [Candidatus Acidoferrales bacterium]
MWLTDLFIKRPTLVTVFLALVLLAGTIAASVLVKQQFPNYDVPTIQISLSYPGGSTTEIRDAIVRPIEDQIAGAPDLQAIETAIQPGQATLVARFSLTSDQNSDLVQIQGRVQNATRQLPSDLQTPTITIYDPSQAVVVSLTAKSATLGAGELSALVTNKVVPAIEQVPGISFVEVNGNVTASIQVEVSPRAMSASGFTLTDVVNAISENNVRAPGGIAYEPNRETSIDIRGDVTTPQSVAQLLLGTSSGSSGSSTSAFGTASRLLRVGDVAKVIDGFEPQRAFGYDHGTPAIALDVQKAANTSEVAASQAVLAELPKLQRQFPDVQFTVQNVQATYTQQQLAGVVRTLAEAIAITGIVMLFFLRSWRSAIVVMIAIPASLLVTLGAMKLLNFTLDTVSLLAMTLIIGILVDDSIVVLENIERHAAEGELPNVAAFRGRSEIGMAALVITLVDVVVFLPISFLPGAVGLFLREFGLVVSVATLTSLFVSFTVTPALAAHWSLASRWKPWKIVDDFTAWFDRSRAWYVDRALMWGLANRRTVIAVSAASLFISLLVIPLGWVGFEYIPGVDRGELFLTLTYPTGTPLETTRKAVLAVERAIDASPDVAAETALAGAYQGNLPGYVSNGAIGQLHVFLKPNRSQSTAQWAAQFQTLAAKLAPGAQAVGIPATSTMGGIQQPIDEVVSMPAGDPTEPAAAAYKALATTPGAIDATTTDNPRSPQVEVQFDRERARALGVDVGTGANAIRAAFGGTLATQFPTEVGLKDVQVIYPQSDQVDLASIASIPIRTSAGSIVNIGDVTTIDRAPAQPLITRINRQNVIYVGANLAPGQQLSNVQRAFEHNLAALGLPAGVTVAPVTGGNQEFVRDTVIGMTISLALSVLLVYLLMVALYNGYRTPFVVMFSVPVAVVGALGALTITHQTLNLFSFIGSVLLIGLVSKNGILLVDFANRLRLSKAGTRSAMIEAAYERFRPIVMTTVAMIAGMLPLALAIDPGAEAERSLGTVVIGGLVSSLALTLLLVPVVYLRLAPSVAEIREGDA